MLLMCPKIARKLIGFGDYGRKKRKNMKRAGKKKAVKKRAIAKRKNV
jgi:hypothetical protein